MYGDPEPKGSANSNEKERATLLRLLATPLDHKRSPKSGVSPKKRGRPPKMLVANSE